MSSGFSVAIIGPDGAGKTTICRRTLESLERPASYVYMGINPEAGSHMLFTARWLYRAKDRLGNASDSAEAAEREARPPRNPLRRVARALKRSLTLINRLADEWYRQSIVWLAQARGRIVLFDRHFLFDFYSSERGRSHARLPLGRRIHAFCLTRFYPRPDLVLLLDAPGEVLFARKGEATPELLEQRRREYRELARLVDHFVVVDATRPEDDVLARVREHIEAFAARRHPAERVAAQG
jgi:thymidylate kinase